MSLYSLTSFPSPKELGIESPEGWCQLHGGGDCAVLQPVYRQCLAQFLAHSQCSTDFG